MPPINGSFLSLPQIFPPEDWLIASSVPSKFSPDAIQNILNELTPETIRSFSGHYMSIQITNGEIYFLCLSFCLFPLFKSLFALRISYQNILGIEKLWRANKLNRAMVWYIIFCRSCPSINHTGTFLDIITFCIEARKVPVSYIL